jgi:hypothetical protein
MFKVTLIFIFPFLLSCHDDRRQEELELFEQQLNKDAENRIDAAYVEISGHCDSLFATRLPQLVDSLKKINKGK